MLEILQIILFQELYFGSSWILTVNSKQLNSSVMVNVLFQYSKSLQSVSSRKLGQTPKESVAFANSFIGSPHKKKRIKQRQSPELQ